MSARGELLAAFEEYQNRVAGHLISGGEGARVRDHLAKHMSFSDFEAGWKSAHAALDVEGLRPNAARYLHIREHSYVEVVCESPRVSRWAPERLDALVDAEMAKGVRL